MIGGWWRGSPRGARFEGVALWLHFVRGCGLLGCRRLHWRFEFVLACVSLVVWSFTWQEVVVFLGISNSNVAHCACGVVLWPWRHGAGP